ncbi:hypothetical protein DPMN_112131 [Dreissena polymorpha]|uniref:Uncharacterized protein n=1 Tax=Dreissena polymorpha TaxID=45954 RepID=A0A9D4KF35_DREPO|nr:hypothetical protein DPMN_112131 [Dreissena polymorpha]
MSSKSTLVHTGECNLKASDLGPDWYKVPQPVPEESEGAGYEPSYVHMPCAPTTMFEISVCGCTNLVSLIFTSMRRCSRELVQFIRKTNGSISDLLSKMSMVGRDCLMKYRMPQRVKLRAFGLMNNIGIWIENNLTAIPNLSVNSNNILKN